MNSIYTPKRAKRGPNWSEEWRRKRDEVEKRTSLRRMLDMEIRARDLNARAQYEAMTDYALRQMKIGAGGMTRLDEFDHIEWWDICRKLRPDVTEGEFEAMWEEYLEEKRRREMH